MPSPPSSSTSPSSSPSYGTFCRKAVASMETPSGPSKATDIIDERDVVSIDGNGHLGHVAHHQQDLAKDVRLAADIEHEFGLLQSIRLYPKAVFWSLFFSLGVWMAAFDAQVIGNLLAVPAFKRDFGYQYSNDGDFTVPAPWQTGLTMGSPLGQVVGAFAAAYPMEWIGRKYTFGICVVLTAALVFIQFFARSLPVLLLGELLGGLVLGTYVVIAPAYASEVCPVSLRGVLTSWTNLSFVGGQLIATGVITGTSQLDSHWAYSAPFAAQWLWALMILIGWPFAPESPWWLVRQNRLADAERALQSLASPQVDVKPALAMIVETDRLEQEIEAGSTYLDCFKKINLRRTEISVGVYSIQVICGVYLVSFATLFFQIAGLNDRDSFHMSVGFSALGFIGTMVSWVLLVRFGRRLIYCVGLAVLVVLLLAVGILDSVPDYDAHQVPIAWSQTALLLAWNFCYNFSVGPICFVILCEVSATKVRSKTIGVATAVQAVLGIVMTVAIPFLINPDQVNARGKVGYFFGGLAAVALVWAFLRVPETSGRTYEELDIMFSRDVPTKHFKKYRFD